MNYAVLLATYNGEKYIKEQIDSILEQSDVNVTIFISDDCSSDGTMDIIKDYQKNNINIILLPKKERMGSASQNFFRLIRDIDCTKFDYICLADQDDIWYKNKLNRASTKIKEKKLDGYSSNVTAFWRNGKQKLIDKSNKEVKWDYLFGSAGPGCTIVLPANIAAQFQKKLIVKKDITKTIDLHDWLIYSYIRSYGLKWYVDLESSMLYRQHENNEFGANSGLKTFFERWRKARNGWYGKQILYIADFCNATQLMPIQYLISQTYLDKLKLAFYVFQLRRKKREAFVLAFMLIVPGFKI